MTYLHLTPKCWNHLNNPDLGFMNTFSENIMRLENKYPNLLPDLRRGSIIFVGSDYSGQHNVAHYESFSFLFADLEQCGEWEECRKHLRQRFLPDGRRLSYKNLGDRKRRRALMPFLNAANSIPGLIATVLVDKRIPSLFRKEGRLRTGDPELKKFSHWDSAVFEKLLRVAHLVSFFVAGLSRPYQDVLWFTDEDAIVANEQRLREFVEIFSNISSHYLKHNLRHLRIGTTKSDIGKRDIEDLVAIADLVAGALSRTLTEYNTLGGIPTTGLMVPPPRNLPPKTRELMNWFADRTQPLKRLVYLIDEEQDLTTLNLKYVQFHGIEGIAA